MSPPADRQIAVGRIAGVFGTKGWVRVFSYTDPPENILRYGPWTIGDHVRRDYRVMEGSVHGRGVIARLDGVDDRDVARQMIGASISVPRTRLPAAGKDEYYWSDLIGLRVINQHGTVLGVVEDLLATGANDVLIVGGERRRLLPFSQSVIRRVDMDAGSIDVHWDEDF